MNTMTWTTSTLLALVIGTFIWFGIKFGCDKIGATWTAVTVVALMLLAAVVADVWK